VKKHSHIEPLEDRIAPALILNPYTVTYQNYETDSSGNQLSQGDTVVVHISKPLFTSATAAGNILKFSDNVADGDSALSGTGSFLSESFTGNSSAEYLALINLQGLSAANGMNISVSVIPQAGVGTDSVNVGYINAGQFTNLQAIGAIDLGSVYIQGNLGSTLDNSLPGITAGSHLASIPAIQSLTVESMTGASTVVGTIGKLSVQGNFTGTLDITGYQFGSIGRLIIGGSLTGDSAGDSQTGVIQFTGSLGSATIGNIIGTSGSTTGELIATSGGIGTLHVTGQIVGGSGQNSGEVVVETGSLNQLLVDHGITGGSGSTSGAVEVNNVLGKVVIGGDITGGSAGTAASASSTGVAVAGDTGIIEATTIHSLSISGSLIGGTPSASSPSTQTADTSGAILADVAGSITIGGSITAMGGPNSAIITSLSANPLGTSYGSIVVGGDVTGGAGTNSGNILSSGSDIGLITSVHIAGDVSGGTGSQTGEISANTGLHTAFIGGDVVGGSAENSGEIYSGGATTSLHIGGGVTGGSGAVSGYIGVNGALGTLYVGKNIVGGSADNSGEIIATDALTTATVKGSLEGNAGGTPISSTATVTAAGCIEAGHIGTLNIGGSVTAGSNSAGLIVDSGAIISGAYIDSITIGGAVTGVAGNPVIISAQQGPGTSAHLKTDLAIGSITVKEAASYLDILAGYGPPSGTVTTATAALGTPLDGSAQIGTLTFESTLSASNIVAGADPDASGQFGTTGNTAILPRFGADNVLSIIAKIVIAGAATGDSTAGDSFGIVAEAFGSIEVKGAAVSTAGLVPGTPSALSGNLNLLEPLET
jgi:hypothetical protein